MYMYAYPEGFVLKKFEVINIMHTHVHRRLAKMCHHEHVGCKRVDL